MRTKPERALLTPALARGRENPALREMQMTQAEAIMYVSFQMDDADDRGRHAKPGDVREGDRLVGFHQLYETVFVAVRSHRTGIVLSDQVAKDLARGFLTEIGWFGEESLEAEFIF